MGLLFLLFVVVVAAYHRAQSEASVMGAFLG